ncbi:MAG TPA: class I SAM-dependent methyltransferase [Pyrinomonadaceae bacterium]|nr:class I SAM-dependent methyltransferase [Pyrinomonadaceae bacterium]
MQNTASQIQYWNRVASQKSFSHPLRADWLTPRLPSGAYILDVGCGYGRTLQQLLEAGFPNCVGLDVSEGMLARYRSEVHSARLVRNDGHDFPLQHESVDAVLLFAVLTCIPADTEQLYLVNEVRRVLRPGGLLYISDLLVNQDARNRERYQRCERRFGRYGVFELPEGVVVRHHSEEWIREITRPFERLEYEPFNVTTMNGNSSSAFQYLGWRSN